MNHFRDSCSNAFMTKRFKNYLMVLAVSVAMWAMMLGGVLWLFA